MLCPARQSLVESQEGVGWFPLCFVRCDNSIFCLVGKRWDKPIFCLVQGHLKRNHQLTSGAYFLIFSFSFIILIPSSPTARHTQVRALQAAPLSSNRLVPPPPASRVAPCPVPPPPASRDELASVPPPHQAGRARTSALGRQPAPRNSASGKLGTPTSGRPFGPGSSPCQGPPHREGRPTCAHPCSRPRGPSRCRPLATGAPRLLSSSPATASRSPVFLANDRQPLILLPLSPSVKFSWMGRSQPGHPRPCQPPNQTSRPTTSLEPKHTLRPYLDAHVFIFPHVLK